MDSPDAAAQAIPWWKPEIGLGERDRVIDVLASDYVNDGSVTRQFEDAVAALIGSPYAVAVTNATSALTISIMALGIGPGDEVIVPDVTFIASANAVTLAGARPVIVDVDPTTLTLCPEATEAAITPHTKAIMPVHISGRAGTLSEILNVARRHGIAVIEDAAEALLSRHDGRALGTFGVTGCISFSPNKIITTGQGGMVFTSSSSVHTRLRELKDQGREAQGTGGDDHHGALGFNFKLTNVQAAIGLGQLAVLSARIDRQRRTYRRYRDSFARSENVRVFKADVDRGELPLWTDAIVEDRDALCQYLESAGVGTRKFWHPIHIQPPYRRPDSEFPVATRLSPKALWLPSAFQLSDPQVERIISLINSFYASRG